MAHEWNICAIDHVAINVSDLEGMTAFYCNILGCTVELRQDNIGLVHLRAGSSLIDLIDRAGPLASEAEGTGHNLNHLCLRADNFDAEEAKAELAALGVDVGEVLERFGSNGRSKTLYFRDPEGNGLELRGA